MNSSRTSARTDSSDKRRTAAAAKRWGRSGRRSVAALLALPFLLAAGTAYAVDDASGDMASKTQASNAQAGDCAVGQVMGRARVIGSSDIPSKAFSGAQAHIIDRYNCAPGDDTLTVKVRREAAGIYRVRFDGGNPTQVAAVTTEQSSRNPSVTKFGPGEFRIGTRDFNGSLMDTSFHILAV